MGFYYSPTIVTDGLQFSIDPANVKSYPGTGTDVVDRVSRNVGATLAGGVTINTQFLETFQLDGSTGRIEIPSGGFNIGTGDFTISAWVNQAPSSTYPHIFSVIDQNNFALKAIRGGLANEYRLYVYQGYSVDFTDSYITPGLWQLITLTREGQIHNLYLNGELSNTETDTSGPKNITQGIGYLGWGWASEYTSQMRGAFDMYNRALTAAEVQQNYNALRGRYAI